jgi:site-specific DNA-methyltransferase (adenine-specific)
VKPYYEHGGITIYHGDCLEIFPLVVDSSVGIVALDPPYSMVPNAFGGADDGAAGTSGSPVRLLCELLRHSRRALVDGGLAALICDWRRVPDVSYLATLMGLRITTCVAWTRSTAGMGGFFRSSWDPMLILSVGQPTCKDRAGVRNSIHVNAPHSKVHPYEKPPELWSHVFQRVPATTVFDPCAGVGSSMVAAVKHGHKWIGAEIEERYCEIAAKRLSQDVLPLGEAV